MNIKKCTISVILFVCSILVLNAQPDLTEDTKFCRTPAISENHIAFVYANNLWIAGKDGSNPRMLTSDEGREFSPVFSPDGKTIAFNAEYDGNIDVYTIPVTGGIPTRLTWHPGYDAVQDFTPDGKSILFSSPREVFTNRYTQLFTIPVEGGQPEKLPVPNAAYANYSPDGKFLAYNPLNAPFRQWKNYRGGRVSTIWLINLDDLSIVEVPQPEGRSNDAFPILKEDKIYFMSDRNGEFNLFSYDIATKEIKQLTNHTDFPVTEISEGKNEIIYNQGGYVHVYDIASGNTKKITLNVAADLPELRTRYAEGSKWVRSINISPTGKRAVLEFRGEIVTVPAEKGDPRNLTNTTGTHERFPVWSPDGKNVAYFSDESGEYQLFISSHEGKGTPKKIKLNGTGFYSNLNWSPDSKKLSFTDNGRNLYYYDVDGDKIVKVDAEEVYEPGAFGGITGRWSPDSKWITYTLVTNSYMETVYVYSLDENKSYQISDGLSDAVDPVFDKNGKYLYFFASTNAGPVKHWFAQSSADMEMTRAIYLVTLQKDLENPLAKENDDEIIEENSKKENDDKKEQDKEEVNVKIDFDGIQYRIVSLPVGEAEYSNLKAGDSKVYYLKSIPNKREAELYQYDIIEKEEKKLISAIYDYEISADYKKLLYVAQGTYGIVDLGESEVGKGKLNIDAVKVKVDPHEEWAQIYDEVWRINRDYFYAENFHGADWDAMKGKYQQFIPYLSCRTDLNLVIQWLCSELSVGHSYSGGGDFMYESESIPGGLLGADYEVKNNRYAFKKIYGGLNWNPGLRSPLKEPGIDVNEGDYLIEVNGKEVTADKNLYSFFEYTAGKLVEIKVAPNPDGTNARTIEVVPIEDENALRNRDWVEGNIKKVHEATDGRCAYVYVPNTAGAGHEYFKRYFFPQTDKDAIIVDERFNGGGLIADYYIDLLRRPFLCKWNLRHGKDLKSPSGAIFGPKVLITDETAGSGGDLFPFMFRKFNIGTIVGKRTWGGLVGILGYPTLMDGGYITAPNLAIYTEDGWVVENEGVAPDVEVDQLPSQVNKGNDPQLEKAIEIIKKQLEEESLPDKFERPPYPVRTR